MSREPTLDCQSCGEILRKLTAAEAQRVAYNPYNYIEFCSSCIRQGYHIEPEYRTNG